MSDIKYFNDSKGNILAILIPNDFTTNGINFITKDDSYQQVAYMKHDSNHVILPHYHNKIERVVDLTTETLVIKKGNLEVVLYENNVELHRFIATSGDVLTLLSGGHGFTCLDEVEMIEIKQGPFLGANDKTRF